MKKRDHPVDPQVDEKSLGAQQEPNQIKNPEHEMKNQQFLNQRKQIFMEGRIMKIKKLEEMPEQVEKQKIAEQHHEVRENFSNKEVQQSSQKECEQQNMETNPSKPEEPKDPLAANQFSEISRLLEEKQSRYCLPKSQQQKKQPKKEFVIFKDGFSKGVDLFSPSNLKNQSIFDQPPPKQKPWSQFAEYRADFMKATFQSSLFHKKHEGSDIQSEQIDDQGEERSYQNQVQIDPSKSTGNYKYEVQNNCLFKQTALKMRKDSCQIVSDVQVMIQSQLKQSQKISWISVSMKATKLPIFVGYLVKGKTEIKNFGGKQENVTLSVISRKAKISLSTVLKLQFESKEKGNMFIQAVKGVLS